MTNQTIRAAILGASGYTGAELVRLLSKHPNVEIAVLTADRRAGENLGAVFPQLGGLDLPGLIAVDDVDWVAADLDVVFCGLPHGTTQNIISTLLGDELKAQLKKPLRVIDLSADFRLEDTGTYAQWYGHEHFAPELQPLAVYGLTEFAREQLPGATLVACPGCYPTGAILPLVPLLRAGLIEPDEIIVDSKSGITGAGRAAKEANLFAEVSTGVHAYGVASHRHGPEMEQELSKAAGRDIVISFTPHLLPLNRGILTTTYVRLAGSASVDGVRECLETFYASEPFVRVLPAGEMPATRHVLGSNHTLIGLAADRIAGRAIIVSAIDNLTKGASGQAVQNMNVMFGFDEMAGIDLEAVFP